MSPSEPLSSPSPTNAPVTKAPAGSTILLLVGGVLLNIGIFAKPLGIPVELQGLPMLPAAVFIYLGYRGKLKAKKAGQLPVLSPKQRRKKFLLSLAYCLPVAVAAPFWLPLTGVILPFTTLVIIAAVSFVICAGAILYSLKLWT